MPIVKTNADKPKAPKSNTGSKPVAKDDLKLLPMPELEKNLGSGRNAEIEASGEKHVYELY
ncbi:MAG: hypothetical protein JXM70_06495 [Pirellulales bacterium]|nr:hypothetical protein [Pirellulales bacterium]